jgi:signal transduction histidine kinase
MRHSQTEPGASTSLQAIRLLSPAQEAGVVQTCPEPGQMSAELAHDARNLFSAMRLYYELLAAPGVLAPGFRHYADDLRMLSERGVRMVRVLAEELASSPIPSRATPFISSGYGIASEPSMVPVIRRHPFPGIEDLGDEISALEAPLRALAGPELRLEVECAPCEGSLALNAEDLLRILFNLVANTAEAMAALPAESRRAGFIRITAQRGAGASFLPCATARANETVVLSVRDNGPGIPAEHLGRIFDPGFTTRRATRPIGAPSEQSLDTRGANLNEEYSAPVGENSGLGLWIVRQLAEAAGGAVRAVSSPGLGTRFDIELPILAHRGAANRLEFTAKPETLRHRRNQRTGIKVG